MLSLAHALSDGVGRSLVVVCESNRAPTAKAFKLHDKIKVVEVTGRRESGFITPEANGVLLEVIGRTAMPVDFITYTRSLTPTHAAQPAITRFQSPRNAATSDLFAVICIDYTRGGLDWRHRAICRDEGPELSFPVGTSGPALLQIAEAKTVCRRCPAVTECLTWALESGQDAGVWGGMSEDERRALKQRNARTRAQTE